MAKRVEQWYHAAGAIHVHTTASDGTKPLEGVARIGAAAGLDYILFADHMTLANRERGEEGMYDGLAALVGYEHNDAADKNHLLIFGSPGVYPNSMRAPEYVAAAAADKAFTIVAHPDEQRDRMAQYPPYEWTDWAVDDVTGIELWNQMSEWMEKLTKANRLAMAFSPRKSMVGPTLRTFQWWDKLNEYRKYVGIASVDAHEFPVKVGPFTVPIFPYKVHFHSLRTYLILPAPPAAEIGAAREQIYSALRNCRAFAANTRWGDAIDFRFWATTPTGHVIAGGELSGFDDTALHVELPERAEIRLICSGAQLVSTFSDRLAFKVEHPGLYRVEAWKRDRCWIFSNHIRIRATGLDT